METLGTDDEYNFGIECLQEDSIYQVLERRQWTSQKKLQKIFVHLKKRMKVSYARGVHEILNIKLSILLDRCKISDRNTIRIATLEALNLYPLKYKVSLT